MPAVQQHSDKLFWQIAVPVMAVIFPLFLWRDIVRFFKYIGKMKLINKVEKKENAKAKTATKADLRRRRTLQQRRSNAAP